MMLVIVFLTVISWAIGTLASTVCTPSQCANGTVDIGNSLGALLSNSQILLLPGQYSSSSPPQVVGAVSLSSITLPPYLSSSSNTLPLTIQVQPGLAVFPSPLFQGSPSFTSLNSTVTNPTEFSGEIKAGSVLLSQNTFAVFEGSNSRPLILWETLPDIAQLPLGSFKSNDGSVTLLGAESTACSTPCSSAGQCTSQGTCACQTGFTGSTCEQCEEGFFGPSCLSCPENCTNCDQGLTGSGRCLSPISEDIPAKCDCENGLCAADGSCSCNAGWTNSLTDTTATKCSECTTGFFKSADGNCRTCSQNCATCSGSDGTCDQCRSGFTPDGNDRTKCVAQAAASCPDGSYPLPTGGCGTCSPLCKTCTGPAPSDCIVCSVGRANFNGNCIPTDASGVCGNTGGLVVDNSKGRCDSCPKGCTACGIPGFSIVSSFESVECSACLPGLVLSEGKCVSECPTGTFVGTDGLSCQACDSSCSTCAGTSGFCLTCSQQSQFALDGKCVSSCPPNTFAQSPQSTDGSGGVCTSCHGDCETCTGSRFDQCSTCKPDGGRRVFSKNTGRCLRSCAKGEWFDDVGGGGCKTCTDGCTSCVGGGTGECTSCDVGKGLVLKEGRCTPANCSMGAIGVLGGVCLEALAGSAPVVVVNPPSNQPEPTVETKDNKGLAWWMYALIGGSALLLTVLALIFWRWRARKRRAMETKMFKQRLEMGGLWQNAFGGVFGRLSRWTGRKRGGRDQELSSRQQLKSRIRWPSEGLVAHRETHPDYDGGRTYGDLEVAQEDKKLRGVEEWRKRISSSHTATTWTTESSEGDYAPEMPVGKRRGKHHRSESSRTLSLYSQVTSNAETSLSRRARRKAPPPLLQEYRPTSSLRLGETYEDLTNQGFPQPRQPLKDTSFVTRGAGLLGTQITGSDSSVRSHLTGQSSAVAFGMNHSATAQLGLATLPLPKLSTQPLIDAPPITTTTTTLTPYQIHQQVGLTQPAGGVFPFLTGAGGNVGASGMAAQELSNGSSSSTSGMLRPWLGQNFTGTTLQSQSTGASQLALGDKNPFRNRLI